MIIMPYLFIKVKKCADIFKLLLPPFQYIR